MKSWLIVAVLCLAGCSGTAPVGRSNVTSQPVVPEPVDATVEYGEAVSGGLESELLYQLLVGEIAGQEGAYEEAVTHYLAAARLAEDPGLAQRAAKIALYARDEVGALAAAEYWRELAPETLEVHQLLANLYVRAGDQAGALGALESALQLAGDTPNYTMLTELLGQFPDPLAAAQVLSGLLQQRADDPVALLTAAALMLRTKEYPAAETALLEVLRRWPDQVSAAELYIELLVQQRRLDEAQAFLQARLRADPSLTVLRLQLARLYVESRQLLLAVEEFENLLEAQPDEQPILFSLGLLNLELKELDAAEGYFRQVAERGEQSAQSNSARYHLGQIAEQRQQRLQAIDWYRQTYEGKYAFLARLRLAILIAEEGDFRQAISELHLGHPSNPQQRITMVLTEAELLQRGGALIDALEVLTDALQLYADDIDLLYSRAMLAGELDYLDMLEADLRKVVEMEPDNVHALNALGYTLADRTERQQEALSFITRAAELSPDNPFVLDSLGWVYYRLGQNQRALEYLSQAFDLMRDNEILAHLGEVLWVSGQQIEARQLLDEGLKRSPDDPVLLEVFDRLTP